MSVLHGSQRFIFHGTAKIKDTGLDRQLSRQANEPAFLGYDKDANGSPIINEKQVKIVRWIYTEFLDGKGVNRIARDLEKSGVPNWHGKAK